MTSVRTLAVAFSAAALVGCGVGEGKAKAGDGPYARQVAAAIPKIEESIGLKFKSPPKVERRTKDEVRAFLTKKFEEDSPTQAMAAQERVYKRFGLLPDSMKLRDYMLELLSEQVAGFYDPGTKTLYIVDGAASEMVNVTISHELVHALQDQYISLDSIQKQHGDDDRQTAAQAVIEGQATYEQMKSMLGAGNLATQFPGGWDRLRDLVRQNQSSMPVFSSAPMVLQETLLFPYLSGMEFMHHWEQKRPGKQPFADMPHSTEQILHESSFFDKKDAPWRVTLPPPNGAKLVYEDDIGEFGTRLFLYQHLQDIATSARGAAGWGGDRYALLETPKGDALVWVTVWDTPIDAGEFRDLAANAIEKRYTNAKVRTDGANVRVYDAGTRVVSFTTGDVDGRPAVLFTDVPAGIGSNVIDLGKVHVARE